MTLNNFFLYETDNINETDLWLVITSY